MDNLNVNLACGKSFIEGEGWINLDYAPSSPGVRRADLLARLPFDDDSVNATYSSHFLEHIPRNHIDGFLAECYRILKPGGILRLVLPDFEEMCREYLANRVNDEHEKADFVIIQIIDQCVRMRSGGELFDFYQYLARNPEKYSDMVKYVRYRNGEALGLERVDKQDTVVESIAAGLPSASSFLAQIPKLPEKISQCFQRTWLNWVLARLPDAFRRQNVSFANMGERHHWLWDFYQLSLRLQKCGFEQIERQDAWTSSIDNFPHYPLDVDSQSLPRKGAESMYVEACKPY